MLRYPRRTLRSSFIIRCIDTFGYVVSLKLEVDHFPGFPGGKEERGKSGWASLLPSPDPPTTFLPEQVCGWSFVSLYLPLSAQSERCGILPSWWSALLPSALCSWPDLV